MAMIREIEAEEGVTLLYPSGREVAVYLAEILSPSRVALRVYEGDDRVRREVVVGECYEAGDDVRVCLHNVRSTKRARLRIHAPREVEIDFADARHDLEESEA